MSKLNRSCKETGYHHPPTSPSNGTPCTLLPTRHSNRRGWPGVTPNEGARDDSETPPAEPTGEACMDDVRARGSYNADRRAGSASTYWATSTTATSSAGTSDCAAKAST
eukprot:scaffold118982_cov75-Phaeocystis_antarctica.AAC.4